MSISGRAGDDRRQCRAELAGIAAALVRPLAEGRLERRRRRAAGAAVSHGRRHGPQERRGRLDHGGRWRRGRRAGRCPDTRCTPFLSARRRSRSTKRCPKRDAAPLSYDFDPRDPVPTIGGTVTSGQPVFEGGALRSARGGAILRLHAIRACRSRRAGMCSSFETRAARRGSSRSPARSQWSCGCPRIARTPISRPS